MDEYPQINTPIFSKMHVVPVSYIIAKKYRFYTITVIIVRWLV